MHTTYLWGLAYRPYGSGAYSEHKLRLLELMLSRESAFTCKPFQSLWQDIREDLQMCPNSSMQTVWDALSSCATFWRKGTMPKNSRWFAWSDSCEEQLPEYHVLKCVLAYHYQNEKLDPDLVQEQQALASVVREAKQGGGDQQSLRREFSKLKESLGGGPKLAYYIMSEKLFSMLRLCKFVSVPAGLGMRTVSRLSSLHLTTLLLLRGCSRIGVRKRI